jgi:endonuclease/exonuclease/phosphatase family metal-dependent hydrolase
MRPIRRLLATTLLLFVPGCADESGDGPVGPSAAQPAEAAALEIAVLTRNMYVGADVDAVIVALASPDPEDDIVALLTAVGTLRETDYALRAAAFADEIAAALPHVVGLQEVSTIDLVIPPLGVDVHLDFLPVLLAELTARGLDYEVAARVRNFDLTPLPGVRLADDDVLLVDGERVAVQATTARRFTANVGEVAPGVVLERGWVSATVTLGGRTYTVASTHLESGSVPGLPQLRALQAAELAEALAGAGPAIVMGDLNDVPGSPMHQALTGAGFADVWDALRPGVVGFTCCHLSDLSNPGEAFDERIDYVFARGIPEGDGHLLGQVSRIGEVPADRVPGPDHAIWPSDHAGLVARLLEPSAGSVP